MSHDHSLFLDRWHHSAPGVGGFWARGWFRVNPGSFCLSACLSHQDAGNDRKCSSRAERRAILTHSGVIGRPNLLYQTAASAPA
jgi:hypothetical protein